MAINLENLRYPKFNLGKCSITHRAHAYTSECSIKPEFLMRRHACGDWGDVPPEDAAANEAALTTGSHIMSAYNVCGTLVWVYTNQETKRTLVSMSGEDP